MAPEVGLEPTTLRLTAECSAIELLRIALYQQLKRGNHANCFLFVIANAASAGQKHSTHQHITERALPQSHTA